MTLPPPPYARVVRGRARYLLRTRLIDPALGFSLGLFARAARRQCAVSIPEPAAVRRLLIVHRMRIGDAVVITPLLRALKKRFTGAALTLVVPPLVSDLFRRDPAVDHLVPFAAREGEGASQAAARAATEAGPADLAFILDFTPQSARMAGAAGARVRIGYDDHGRGFGLTHTLPWPSEWNRATADYPFGTAPLHQAERWLALGALVGASLDDGQPRLYADRLRPWEDLLPGAGISEDACVLLLHPGSDPAYRWLPERWAQVAETLAGRHALQIVISAGPADASIVHALQASLRRKVPDTLGRSIADAVDVAARAALVLTVDTSLSHIASAVGTPVVTLFGPGDPAIWRPYGPRHAVVLDPTNACGGCKLPRCPLAEHLCMDGIRVEQVIAAAERILQARPA